MKKLIMYLHPTVKIVTPLGYPAKYPFNQMVNRILPDELNPYPIKLAVEPFHEIAALPVETKTFEELSFQRALELKRNINEDIYIKYSGGIDSATALISIMRSWSSDELQRVHVIMSKDSIDEFPEMWPVLYKTFRGRLHNTHNDIRIFAEKGHVISGEMGDQLWGSSIMYQLADRYGIDTVFQPWQNIMHQYWYDFHFLGKTAAYGRGVPDEKRANLEAATLVERHSSTLKYCPFPIRTAFDWIWWFNYNNKLHHVLLRDFCWCDLTGLHHRIHAFYNTPYFQRWSLDNHDIKIKKDFVSYKQQAKDFIIKHTGFENYQSKLKVGSAVNLWISKNMARCNYGLDEDYNLVSREDTFKYVESYATS